MGHIQDVRRRAVCQYNGYSCKGREEYKGGIQGRGCVGEISLLRMGRL